MILRTRRAVARHRSLGLALGGLLGALWTATPADAFLPLIDEGLCEGRELFADSERVHVDTPLGRMTLQLFPSVAPETVQNFLGYIDRGDYTDTIAHRVVPDFVIQAGGFRSSGVVFEGIETVAPVDNEPCVSNVAGTIAMAKFDNQPNSATSQWFVNLVDNTGLDGQNGGFTVFGRVLGDGLDVAIAISEIETTLDDPADPMDPTGPKALPELPPFYAVVLNPDWFFFRSSPIQSLPTIDPPPAYGCFDSQQAGIVLIEDPQGTGDWEPNVNGLAFNLVSTACQGAGTGGTPTFACSDPGRRVLLLDAETGAFIPDAAAEFGFAEVAMSCEDLAAAEASFATRLDAIATQLNSGFVQYVYTVPEPGTAALCAASLLTLAALRRRVRRGC